MVQKHHLSDSDHGMIVGARGAGLSISESADLLGFSEFKVFAEYENKTFINYTNV